MELLDRLLPSALLPQKPKKPGAYSLIDIGRDTVKAIVVLFLPDSPELQLIGYGMAETGGHDIAGGRLEAAAVTGPVNIALTQAEDRTETVIGYKVVPDHVIFALAGRAVVGKLFAIHQVRSKPMAPISAKELGRLRLRAERLVRQSLAELPLEGGQWQALAVNDAGLHIDDHLVLDGVGLTGRNIALSVFGVAAQSAALRALELLAKRLDLLIVNIVASSQGLASLAPGREAIILDTGSAGTDVCLIRNDALVATKWVPFGGGFFTQVLAQALQIKPERAKEIKHALADNELSQPDRQELEAYLEPACQRWYETIMETLVELSPDKPLPWKIYLTGRGNLVPVLDRLLRSDPAPFKRAPEVTRLGQRPVSFIKDLTDGLDFDLFSLALGLTAGLPD